MSDNAIKVENNTNEEQYEIHLDDGQLAILAYEREGDRITYLHTSVPPAFEGHGLAGKLAQTALEDARSAQLTVVPLCPFVSQYIKHHPEYQSLVTKKDS
ncbi:N-acetyltransferase [Dictyobacter alpinus]|uniref:N-acetyltransferase n=1 Tax=Dictyobacter alpinus TaxID=2014873 RepID=A0A402BGI5_9CHLR|nr:GNAT family N-acetyltransferase [Dictyobacter alpinus]GCE30372.1 N-acetyltransferase [Dictyobacter alpinus]